MKNIKIFTSILMAICLAFSAIACQANPESTLSSSDSAVPDPTETPSSQQDRNAVAVKLDDIEITAGEIEDNYNSYMEMLSYYGMNAPTDDASISEYVQMIVEDLLTQQLPLWKAKQLGIELSEEELKQIDTNAHNDADAEYTDLVLSYAAYFTDAGNVDSVSALTDEQLSETLEALNADVQAYYNDTTSDIDVYISDAYDAYYKEYLVNAYADKLRAQNDATISVDDETIESWYADALNNQKDLFDSDPTQYRMHHDSLSLDDSVEPLLYVPDGLALIKLITLTPESEIPDSISSNLEKLHELEAAYGKLALNGGSQDQLDAMASEYASLLSQNEQAESEYFENEKNLAENAYERLSAGEDFDLVATDVTGSSPITHLIWYAGEDYNFSAEVRNAVASLNEGTFSEILFDGESYYIVYMVGHLAAGAVDRAPIAESIAAAAAVEQRDAAWEELMSAWEEEALNAAVFNRDAYAYVGH